MTWILLIMRMAGEPSRHRVAVWRELRRVGAVPLTQGVWALPNTPAFVAAIDKVTELVGRGSGKVISVDVSTRDDAGAAAISAAFIAARLEEWAEYTDDCDKFEAEIAKEIRIEKFTLAELEEEEQSLDRLRRWYRDLKVRDVFELPAAAAAEQRLKECTELLENYADKVYEVIHDRA